MFRPHSTIESVKEIHQQGSELIVCFSDKGIAYYNSEGPAAISSLTAWFACVFNDLFLFQPDNGGNIYYFSINNQEQPKIHVLEGSLYLFRSMHDDNRIFIPTGNSLHVFDRYLRYLNSYVVGKVPVGARNDKYYRISPHLACFSLADNAKLWEVPGDALLQRRGTIPGSYFYVKGDLLAIRSRFNGATNFLTALHADTGEIVWQHQDYIPATTLIEEDIYTFYYHDMPRLQGRCMVIDVLTGEIKRDADITRELSAKALRPGDHYLLAKNGQYLFAAGVDSKTVLAFNMDSGKVEWQHTFNTGGGWLADIKFYDNTLFIMDDEKRLHVFKRE